MKDQNETIKDQIDKTGKLMKDLTTESLNDLYIIHSITIKLKEDAVRSQNFTLAALLRERELRLLGELELRIQEY